MASENDDDKKTSGEPAHAAAEEMAADKSWSAALGSVHIDCEAASTNRDDKSERESEDESGVNDAATPAAPGKVEIEEEKVELHEAEAPVSTERVIGHSRLEDHSSYEDKNFDKSHDGHAAKESEDVVPADIEKIGNCTSSSAPPSARLPSDKAELVDENQATASPSPFQLASFYDVQPLPENPETLSRSNNANFNRKPGAYAVVGGIRFSGRPPAAASATTTDAIRNTSSSHVAHTNEAVFEGELALDLMETVIAAQAQEQRSQTVGTTSAAATDLEIIDGKILDESRGMARKRMVCLYLIAGIILVGGLVVIVVLLLLPSTAKDAYKSNENITSNNFSDTQVLHPPYRDGLPARWVKRLEALGSPPYYANLWMLQDPNLQSYSKEKQDQRSILAVTYLALNGDNWTRNDHWMSYTVDECLWFSQSVDDPVCDEHGNYITFNLTSNNLEGSFEFAERFLPYLVSYDVSNNNIEGLLHSGVNTNRLETFIVSNNKFEGQLTGLEAPALKVVKMDGNRLWGSSASAYAYKFLPHLEIINVTNNHFAGIFTPTLKYCKNLTYIGFGNNDVHGNIPSELGLLTALKVIDIKGNPRINGTIPIELGTISTLTTLNMVETSVTGPTPSSLCDRVEEGVLVLSANCSAVECCA